MSRKRNAQNTKAESPSKFGEFVKSLPTWLKFIGLLVPILGFIVSFLSYQFEKQKYTDDIKILVSTDSTLNIEGGKFYGSPPVSVSIISKNKLICGRDLIVSNIGGIPTALVGFQGQFSHASFSQPITFEGIGNNIDVDGSSYPFLKGLSGIHITILKDNTWFLSPEVYSDDDVLAFPIDVQDHSSLKVRIAFVMSYTSGTDASATFGKFNRFTDMGNSDNAPRLSLQLLTSTSKISQPVEFKCFEGIIFSPDDVPTPSPA
jgi:hypothetical protein